MLQGKIPVFGFSFYRNGIAERAARINKLLRTQGRTAAFTLVAECIGIGANRAGACDITVCQKGFVRLVRCAYRLYFRYQGADAEMGGLLAAGRYQTGSFYRQG